MDLSGYATCSNGKYFGDQDVSEVAEMMHCAEKEGDHSDHDRCRYLAEKIIRSLPNSCTCSMLQTVCIWCRFRQMNLTWTKRDMLSGGSVAVDKGLTSQLPDHETHPCLTRKACRSQFH